MKTLIDRPHSLNNRILDKMIAELSPHMTEFEIDRVVEFMWTIDNSKYDINYSTSDAASQIKLIVGSERYEQIKAQWALKNSHLINGGITKYIRISDGTLWDGLDPEDNPGDYRKVTM